MTSHPSSALLSSADCVFISWLHLSWSLSFLHITLSILCLHSVSFAFIFLDFIYFLPRLIFSTKFWEFGVISSFVFPQMSFFPFGSQITHIIEKYISLSRSLKICLFLFNFCTLCS